MAGKYGGAWRDCIGNDTVLAFIKIEKMKHVICKEEESCS
jgi:hypothetical protein